MSYPFSTALAGLRASSDYLGVVGNNIANANTLAYKTNTISFSDIFYNSLSGPSNSAGQSLSIGNGVMTAGIGRDFSQGNLSASTAPTDMGIAGNGYFVMRDPSTGIQSYTRAGNFVVDRNGFLLAPSGQQLQGYAAVNGVVPSDAPLTSLQLPLGQTLPPKTTTDATLQVNLNAADPVGTQFNASVQVYDSLGVAHTMDVVYTKTSDLNYSVSASLDGNAATIAPAALVFDTNGKLTTPAAPAPLVITPDQTKLNGASLPTISVDLYKPDGTPTISNFAATSAVSATTQDGYSAAIISGLSIDKTGVLTAVFNNGQSRPIGQVALALFNSQDGLKNLGGNLLAETTSSGPASIGRPSAGGRGDVIGSTLEQSNVDIATEFTNLITAQRSFQANSRVITTINQTLQDLLQIV